MPSDVIHYPTSEGFFYMSVFIYAHSYRFITFTYYNTVALCLLTILLGKLIARTVKAQCGSKKKLTSR